MNLSCRIENLVYNIASFQLLVAATISNNEGYFKIHKFKKKKKGEHSFV